MSSSPFINPANQAPGVKTGHTPGNNIACIMEKKIFWNHNIFSMWQCRVLPHLNLANQTTWVQTGKAPSDQ